MNKYYKNYISILTFCLILVFTFTGCSLSNKNKSEDTDKKEEKIYSLNIPINLGDKWEYNVEVVSGDQKNNFTENHEIIDVNRESDSSKIFWTVLEKVQNKETTSKKYYGMNWNQTEFYLNEIIREGIDVAFGSQNNNQNSNKNTVKELYNPGILIARLDKEGQQDINSRLKEDIISKNTKYYNVLGNSNIYGNQTIEVNSKKFESCVKSVVSYKKIDEKTDASMNISEIYWICPKIGIVKYIYTSGDSGNTITKELKSYKLK